MNRVKKCANWKYARPPEPGDTILFCFCGLEVHRTSRGDLRHPDVLGYEIETAAEEHLQVAHPRRYRLWQRLGWRWLLNGMAP